MGRKGWGAYSIDALAEGTFVADYTGEALPVEEARKRVPKYDQDGLNYVLTTQEFFQEASHCAFADDIYKPGYLRWPCDSLTTNTGDQK